MALTPVQITGTWQPRPNTYAPQGSVTFLLSTPIGDGAGMMVTAEPIICYLNNGSISEILWANDDPTVTPTGSYYSVTEFIDGVSNSYRITVPHTAANGVVNLAALPRS